MPLSGNNQSFDDVRCPLCYFILLQPVTLPCTHKLCLSCFEQQVEVNYICPICRHRLSNWARNVSKEKTLVDAELWSYIQKEYPDIVKHHTESKKSLVLLKARCRCGPNQCKCLKLSDINKFNSPGKPEFRQLTAAPGEIRREYLEQIQKINKEKLDEQKANEDFLLSEIAEPKQKKLLRSYISKQGDVDSDVPQMRSRSATGCKEAEKCVLYRSPSTSSIDSITPEFQGFVFKPIHCSPRTPPRRFGACNPPVSTVGPSCSNFPYPPVIRSVPRVLDDTSSESSFASSCSSISNIRGGSSSYKFRRYPTRATRATRKSSSVALSPAGSIASSEGGLTPSDINMPLLPPPKPYGSLSSQNTHSGGTNKRKAMSSETEKENHKCLGAVGGFDRKTPAGGELPDFKRLRLQSSMGSPIPRPASPRHQCLPNENINPDHSLFINRRKSGGVDFFDLDSYHLYMSRQKHQEAADYHIACELQGAPETPGHCSSDGEDQSPVEEERTYSLRTRKVVIKQ